MMTVRKSTWFNGEKMITSGIIDLSTADDIVPVVAATFGVCNCTDGDLTSPMAQSRGS